MKHDDGDETRRRYHCCYHTRISRTEARDVGVTGNADVTIADVGVAADTDVNDDVDDGDDDNDDTVLLWD